MASRLGGGRGYLIIDHTDSPGISEEMAPAVRSFGSPVVGAGAVLELDTWTCSHCNRIVLRNPDRVRPREVCRKCMAVVCDSCSLWCEPFAKLADAIADGKFHALPSSPLLVPGKPL